MSVLRRGAWLIGAPLRVAVLGAIGLYRITLSGRFGDRCKYHPSCSAYADKAIRTHGVLKGSLFAAWRLLRCNPFSDGGIDGVPARGERRVYDYVLHRRRRASGVTG